MPNYFYNDIPVSEDRVFNAAKNLGLSVEDYLKQNPGFKVDPFPSIQDNISSPNIIIPKIDDKAPLNSSDFYFSNVKEEKEDQKIIEEAKKEETEFKITPQFQESVQDRVTPFNVQPLTINKEDAEYEKKMLTAWLNQEYFGKGVANQVMGTYSLTAYEGNDSSLGKLKKDFKSNLGKLGISRTAYPNLTDSDLDDIFTEVFNARVNAEKREEGEKDERIKINDIIAKKEKGQEDAEAIELAVNKMHHGKINTGGPDRNGDEAKVAQIIYKLRNEDLTAGEEKAYRDMIDPSIEGSLGDIAFNKDEMKYDATTRTMRKTGRRISKYDKGYKVFHDPVSGRNISIEEARAVNNNGGAAIDVTDAMEVYLTRFKNTSDDDLNKYASRLLLEEAGYKIENEQVDDYYVGDLTIRNRLRGLGYESDGKGVFKDVPLGILTNMSHVPGTWDFWSPNAFMSKGEIIPQNYKDKPYKNEKEFIDFLETRRKQGHDIAAKNAALWQTHYINRDISSISKNRTGQFFGTFSQQLLGENITAEQFPTTNQKLIDTFGNQILSESGVDVTEQQEEIFERTFADEVTEAGGGLTSMLLVLSPINKIQKLAGINKMIAAISAPRYVSITGKTISQREAIKISSKFGKNLKDWSKGAGYTKTSASSLHKGAGYVALGVYEDIKMKEVLGSVTGGRMEFERGVGFGFALAPKFIPYGFGRFAQGKRFNLNTGNNQFNTFLQSTFVNAPSFALAVEGGDALGALVKDLQGKQEIETWASHHWSDRDQNMRRIGLNLITGKGLGLMHFNSFDFKTTTEIGKFHRQTAEFIAQDYNKLQKLADANKMELNDFINKNPNHKEVQKLQRHWEDFNMTQQRLDLINSSAEWFDLSRGAKKTYENHYKPLTELFQSKGKKLKIFVSDKPIYQTIIKNGKKVKQEVSALYTRLGQGKNKDFATIEINVKKAKGKQYANHEGLHAYLDLMFEGNIRLKENFTNSFKEALKSIKTPGSNLYLDILKTKDIKELDKLEEMMAYSAEYLGKAEYYNTLVGNQAFTKMKKFWNNFAGSVFPGLKADLTLKQDIIDLLGTYGKTGDIRKLERLNEIIEYDPTGKAREGQVATTDVNKTIEQVKNRKADILQEIKDLRTAQPKGYENTIKEKTDLYNELNANQRKLENKVEIEKVDVAKEGWDQQIDKNYTIGKYKSKDQFVAEQQTSKNPISKDIMNSTGLENQIKKQATLMKVPPKAQPKFVLDVKERIVEKFLAEYNPSKVNKEFGRELTPFGWLTHRTKYKPSIIYRAAGDIAKKYKESPKFVEADAYEGGYGAFENYSTETGHMNTSKTFDSKIERDGVELSEQPAMRKKVGDRTLGEIIDQKSGADAKNLDFTKVKPKEIVSYKNIQPNAERTIGKEVAVDYYGMSLEMHKKTVKNKSQWLNNDDITNILDVIKNNIGTELSMMPRWKQSIIDKYTGQEVAFDIVGGKFPSEPKATGTTTSVLKLTDANGKPLIYEPIPQTGTKGAKYKFTKRYEEWLETTDQAFKTEFEQDVIEALSRGNKAEISGKLKGWIMQRKKAMYVQGVDKALPNTPELTVRFTLAEMANQLTAGKNPTLASAELNKIIKQLIGDLNKNLTLGKDYSYKEMVKLIESDKYKNKFSKKELNAVKNDLEAMKERLLSKKEQEAIKAKEEMTFANSKEYVNNFNFKSGEVEVSMEILSDQLGFNVTPKHLEQAANNTIQRSRFTGKKDGKRIINRKNLEDFHEMAGEYWKQFSKDFGITFAKNMIGDPLGGRKNGWYEIVDGKLKAVKNTDPILDLNRIYNANVGKSVNPAFEGLTTKYAKGSKIAKGFQKARELAERGDMEGAKEVMESILSKFDQKTKRDLYQALGKAQEAVILNSKNVKDYIKRATFVFDVAKNNSSATEGERILTTTIGVRLKKGEKMGLKNPLVKELIKEGVKVEDALKKDVPKVEHVKSSLEASFDKGFSVNQLKWSLEGPSLAKKYLGVISSVGRLDKIDVAGLKTNPAGLARMALIRNDLKNNLEFVEGKFTGKTFEDLLMADAAVELKSLGVKVELGELKQDYMFEAVNKFIIESSRGNAELVSQTFKNKDSIKRVNKANKTLLEQSIGKKMANAVASTEINKTIKIIDKAIAEGRKRNKKTKGGSFWDADDTLLRSKSGVIFKEPNPSGKPQPSRKVIFLAGGAGSGKSNVVKQLGLEKQGFKVVNSDISLEWLKKNNGLPENMKDLTKEQASQLGKLQWQARKIAARKQMKFQGKGDGIVVDGTGGSMKVMEKQVAEFKEKGYDVQMLFVETSLETALARNKARKERTLKDIIVIKNHEAVQGNKGGFKKLFGKNFAEVKTDNLKMGDTMPPELIAKMDAFTKGYKKGRLTAEEFANEGSNILERGGEFDFSEFNKVVEGETGPLFGKALERAKKFGTKDQFIVTARPPEAQQALYEFFKSQGLEIPLKNIYCLGNSTAEAKALKIAEKISEGYNDIYFADDVLLNVQAVKNIMEQFDVKGKVQQALATKDLNKTVNDIMEYSLGIKSKKKFSKAEAKVRGKDIKRRRIFMTDSAADLELLIEPLYGKGKEGIENKKWFDKEFIEPFERGIRDYNTARQTAKNQYMSLRKQNKDIVKQISKPVEGTSFTLDMAMRVYLWNKAGYKVPDLAKATETKLVEHIKNNPKLQVYAENFAKITKQQKGLKEPGENWWAETLAGEVTNIDRGVSRKQYLQEWIDIKNEIFSIENFNKMESKLGTRWRENIEDMFDRMATGRTRSLKLDRGSAAMMSYLNGSVGTIMNFNTRSAALQTISTVNFLNMRENNPIAAARAMGNVKQFSTDFMKIMNSDMLKQRRDGLEINVTEAEIASAAAGSKNPINAMIARVLKVGYLPTKLADSFAISFGGATFYRNRIKMYEKQGMSKTQAEAKAWLDFQKLSERTQQSSRPDLLSKQQTSLIGRFILPFANTPLQMNRLGIKEILDLSKGRYKNAIEASEKMGRVTYYMGAQVALFAGLQSALFAMLLNDDDVSEEKIQSTKTYALNTVSDSFLRGMGIQGAVISGFKNATIEYAKQNKKPGFTADYSEVGEALLNISPPIGSKFSKLDQAGNIMKWAKINEDTEFKLELGNPSLEASTLTIEALTNIPLNRAYKKSNNIKHSLNSDYENWQRAHMFGGWSPYNVGIESEKKKSKSKKKKRRQPLEWWKY